MQNIGIDCRLAGIRHAGIGRYIENLVKRLVVLEPDFHWILFFYDQEQAQQVLGDVIHLPQVEVILTPIRHYSLAEQLQLPQNFRHQDLDLLHVPHFNVPLRYKGKLIITIHDLLWHEYRGMAFTTLPSWLYYLKYLSYRFIVSQAVHKALKILVPAETIRLTLLHFYPELSQKITVTKEGVDDRLLVARSPVTQSPAKNQSKILLYVGSLYPHKNLKLVIDALAELPGYELWIVGTRNVFQERVQAYVSEKGLVGQVKFCGYLSDQELSDLRQKVTALVQPSFSEGFGLTGLEAMAFQIPLLASDIAIFKEIYQDGAIYFDPHSLQSFVAACQKLSMYDLAEQKKLLAHASHVAEQYSWDKTAVETLQAYRQLLT